MRDATCPLPPGPPGLPILGHAVSISRGALEFLRRCADEYGDLVPLRFVGKRILFVNDPDDVAAVLAANHRNVVKGIARRSDYLMLGEGISLSEGDAWRRARRLIQPAFHRERVAAYGEQVTTFAERMLAGWRVGETRDLRAELRQLTLAIVGKTLFGIDPRDEAAAVASGLARVLECREARARSLDMVLPAWFPTPTNLAMRRARRDVDEVVQRLIDARRNADDGPDDLVALLLAARDEAGRPMPDRQVRDEVRTIFVGGHETAADLLAWTCYLLAQHPEVEARLRDELDRTLGGRSASAADLPRLAYADAIVAEALRLYPPAPVLTREVVADFELGGRTVARGTEIVLSPWVMHRNPRYFPDPDRFDPDRWTAGLANRLPRYAYFPFGGGPRLCIGKSFAIMEAVLVVAAIVQRFHLELLPGERIVPDEIPTLHPKPGLPMRIEPRRASSGVLEHARERAEVARVP